MAGYKPEDLEKDFIPEENFTPEEGVDTTKTAEQKIEDLAQVEGEENVDKEAEVQKLKDAEQAE